MNKWQTSMPSCSEIADNKHGHNFVAESGGGDVSQIVRCVMQTFLNLSIVAQLCNICIGPNKKELNQSLKLGGG